MNRVTIVNLAGHAWHVEEAGVATLDAWLEIARQRLATDPDRDELILDFERAIADRCEQVAPGNRDVVSASQVDEIVAALGSVEPADGTEDAAQTGSAASPPRADAPWRERRLYRLTGPDESMLAGVCSGLSAYFNVDVTVVRLIVVVLTVLTSGAGLIGYIVLALVVPEAKRPEDRAAAFGHGQTAQELMSRARVQASPALATLGSLIARTGTVLARAIRWILLAALWTLLAAWALAIGSLVVAPHALMDAFDPGTSAWIGGLWLTCIAWIPITIIWSLERLAARLGGEARARSRGMSIALSSALVVSVVAAVLGIFAIPASHSRELTGLSDGQGRVELFGQDVCVNVDDAARTTPGCRHSSDIVVH